MSRAVQGLMLDEARAAGCDPDGLRRAFGLLDEWIDTGVLPGAAALVARGGQIAGEAYLGLADRAQRRPATEDTIWSLASITKPVTATAAMLLVERGRVSLDEPLGQLLPEFLDAPATAFAREQVTLRHLLSHCSGLPGFAPDNLDLRRARRPLSDFVGSFSRQPLLFQPGTAHYYSNCGMVLAAEVVGRSIAGTLGQRVAEPAIEHYHTFVTEQILVPLGMTASALRPPQAWWDQIAWVEDTGQEGTDWEMANSAYYRGLGIPWGGLFSRPRDLVRFVDLFLPSAGGRPRVGVPAPTQHLLSSATVQAMTSVQFAPPDAPAELAPELRDSPPLEQPRAQVEWGIGWEIKGAKHPHRSGTLTAASTFGHSGASGTMVWADPARDIACILLTNRAARSGWTTERPRQALFSNAVMAAVR